MDPGWEGGSQEACQGNGEIIQMTDGSGQGDEEKWRGLKAIGRTVKTW